MRGVCLRQRFDFILEDRGFGPQPKKYRFVLWNNRMGFRFILPVEKLKPFNKLICRRMSNVYLYFICSYGL